MAKCLQKETSMRVRAGLLHRLRSETRGQELVEFAFVIWILMGLMVLIFWCGRALSIYQAVERAAREGARVYLMSTCATCGNTTGNPTAAINRVLKAATLDPSKALPAPTFTPDQVLVSSNLPSYGQVSGVTVTVSYPLQLNMPMMTWFSSSPTAVPSFPISSTVTMRQEY